MNPPDFRAADPAGTAGTAVALAWYRPEQWGLLRTLAIDADRLTKTHAEWLIHAEKTSLQLRQQGLNVCKVDVDINELSAWCQARSLPLDGAARSRFALSLVDDGRNQG